MSKLSAAGQALEDWYRIQSYITFALLFPVGLFGSVISVFVYSRKTFINIAMGKYLTAQACAEILMQAYSIWIAFVTEFNQFECRGVITIFSVAFAYNSLIKAVVSFDRMLLVQFPTKFSIIKKPKFQYSVIVVMAVLSTVSIIITQQLTAYESIRNNVTGCYVVRFQYNFFISYIYRTYDLYITQLIPFSVMFVCGIIICRKVLRMRKKMNKSKSKTGVNKERALTIYTVFFISYYLFLSSFHMGSLTYQLYIYDPFNHSDVYTFMLRFGIFMKNVEINSSFVVYMVFNKLYRAELFDMVREILYKLRIMDKNKAKSASRRTLVAVTPTNRT